MESLHTPSSSTTLHRLPDMQELIHDFVQETISGLERTEPLVESLGENNIDAIEKNIRILFRSFHSMKGVAGFLQFMDIQDLAHEAETLFDTIREKPSPQPESILDLIYETFDCLRKLVYEIAYTTSAGEHHEHSPALLETTKNLIQRLIAAHGVSGDTPSSSFGLSASPIPHHTYLSTLKEHAADLLQAIQRAESAHHAPDPDAIVPVVDGIHTIINNPTFKSWIQDNEEALTVVQSATVFADMIVSGDLSLDVAVLTTLHSQINTLLQTLLTSLPLDEQTPVESFSDTSSFATDIARNDALYQEVLHEEFSEELADTQTLLPSERGEHPRSSASSQQHSSTERSEIRVETAKLDRLFDLVGELVTMQTMAFNSPDIVALKLPQFRKSATMLGKITRQLQAVTMSMRMAPVEILFVKMRRVVREISGRVGKMVELHLNGADTEMDKNLIDLMFDALVHIVRNAIDHGIELPHERAARGKSETGTIVLSALYEGNDIVISIRDDGNGLDRERILQRAVERGVAPTNTDALTDEEVWNFIFEPGFSTAEVITDISGRGVGMDVVRQNIERLRGKIQVASRTGIGTTVTLRIPLTLASMDVMLVRVGTARYAIPLGSVRQSFRPLMGDITTTMDGLEVVRVREALYPILRLHEVFHQSADTHDLTQGILIIVESHTRRACILVDEVLGQQQTVIKSLSQYIGTVSGLSGCMILSDGHIGLILDPEDLIRQAEERVEQP